jgi:hypothetical protein
MKSLCQNWPRKIADRAKTEVGARLVCRADIPVRRSWRLSSRQFHGITGPESPVNRQAGKPALLSFDEAHGVSTSVFVSNHKFSNHSNDLRLTEPRSLDEDHL